MYGCHNEDPYRRIERQIELLVQTQAQFQTQLQAQQQQQKQNDLNVNVANTGSIDLVLVAVLVRLAFGGDSEEASRLMNQAIEANNKSREEMTQLVKALVAR